MADNNQQLTTPREEAGKFAMTIRSPEYQAKFKAMLPKDVDADRFTAVVLRAVQEDPNLLRSTTDKASLFLACQRAAQDGLMPDKREGALVMYGNQVQWQPMIGGLRKVLAGAGFDLRAECVYANDTFDYDLGDTPSLTHRPAPLGTPRGDLIGAYAVATNMTTGEKYREVMSLDELNAVANVSRAGNSGPWKGPFKGEMYRKTVAKRLKKSLPIDDRRLQDIIDRDNEQFDLTRANAPEPSSAAKRVQAAVRAVEQPQSGPQPDEDVIEGHATEVVTETVGEGPGMAGASVPEF
jgi:recombination protein RecT